MIVLCAIRKLDEASSKVNDPLYYRLHTTISCNWYFIPKNVTIARISYCNVLLILGINFDQVVIGFYRNGFIIIVQHHKSMAKIVYGNNPIQVLQTVS